jgi:putative ABC transport system permease protein
LGLDKDPGPEIYYPFSQAPFLRFTVAVRYSGTPAAALAALRAAVRDMDPNQPLGKAATMDELISQSNAPRRFPLVLFSAFGLVAMGIAAAGIYGVVSHSVSRRTQELGIRMALGATAGSLLRMILRQALLPVAIGAAGGLGLAVAATRYLENMLFGVRPTDPPTLAAACLALLVVAAAASLGPSVRACRTDPVEALRDN